ncbi:GTPase domain-containing protein [bacterium]|nr:GTPase domain-containing protein [bacterium]
MELNLSKRELTLKLVYYGPALSGKTTNLQMIHHFLHGISASDMVTLDTQNDRTLFFDLLPLEYVSKSGFKVKFKLFTVPGQVIHSSTRRIVLKGADGVVFVADSQRDLRKENNQSYRDLLTNLSFHNIEDIPIIVQFNKRDLPNILSKEEVEVFAQKAGVPVTAAIALSGKGVLETFSLLIQKSYDSVNNRFSLAEKFYIYKEDLLNGIFHKK